MSNDRSLGRDVHLYRHDDPTTVLGGLVLNLGVTRANFHSMIEIFILFDSEYTLHNESSNVLPRDELPLLPGKYFIVTEGSTTLTNEVPLLRTISLSTGTRIREFRDAVRDRDKRCLITGEIAWGVRGHWRGYDAAHIFPLAYEGYWQDHDYGRWIKLPPSRGGKINSVQNGLLLRSDLHQLFDFYDISVNPDDDYKVVVFDTDKKKVAGTRLDDQFRSDPRRPADELLRWHFRQAVLSNVKGAGVPSFEHDFPPGSDMLEDIRQGPMAAERMEFEMFSRLGASMSCYDI